MKISINFLIILSIFISCSTDETPENTILPIEEEIEENALLEKSFVIDDGHISPETTYSYNANNQITEITFGTTADQYWRKTEITYIGNSVSTVTYIYPNDSIEYQVSDINNTISLINTNHLIEIDYTGDYVDAYRKFVPNSTNIALEIIFTRGTDNNVITQTINTPPFTTTYNYSNYDSSPSVHAHNTFNNNDWLIFGLKSTENNPLTFEIISHSGTVTLSNNNTLTYDDQGNVINWSIGTGATQLNYEYSE